MSIKSLGGMLETLSEAGMVNSSAIEAAFAAVDRKDFVPEKYQELAYEDTALPLFEGQTISQPSVVAFMLGLLNVKAGQTILDIGAGSGWTTCLLGYLVGRKGRVYGYEINPVVGEFGQGNIIKYDMPHVEYRIGNATDEWSRHDSFDRIIGGASMRKVPAGLLDKLNSGGILVVPTWDGYIKKFTRQGEADFNEEAYYGFEFVPFIENR